MKIELKNSDLRRSIPNDLENLYFKQKNSNFNHTAVQRRGSAFMGSPTQDLKNRGPGQPLDSNARDFLEPHFGYSFENVRIHTDTQADQLSKNFNATAFTTGTDVFFREGAYNPNTRDGMHLLAHELTHTIQQSQGPVSGTPNEDGISISDPNDSFEIAAEQTANTIMNSSAPSSNAPATEAVQREANPEEDEQLQLKPTSSTLPTLQRETAPEEEEEIQTKRDSNAPIFLQRETMPEEEEEVQTKREPSSGTATVQREMQDEEEDVMAP